jgi:hypothetical protein
MHSGIGRIVGSIALVATVAAATGCGGGVGGAAGQTPQRMTSAVTKAPPGVDPEVAQWARKWKHRIAEPMRRAAATLTADAESAAIGDSRATYRLTPALNALSNCRNPLDVGLAQPPETLIRARKLTLAACRAFFVGTDTVVDGLNAQSTTTTRRGVRRVRHGLVLLRSAEHAVARAVRPQ